MNDKNLKKAAVLVVGVGLTTLYLYQSWKSLKKIENMLLDPESDPILKLMFK